MTKGHSILACLPGLSIQSSAPSSDKGRSPLCFGFETESENEDSLPHPPPPQEVFPLQEQKPFKTDPVTLNGGLTLLKGRVSTAEVFGIQNSDLVPGRYEGGLKLWEGSTDLVDTLRREIQDGQLSFRGKHVLEVGCGHGLPGIFACIKGASIVHFQDFNAEVLQKLTIPNVNANIEYAQARLSQGNGSLTPTRSNPICPEVCYYAGDWSNVHSLLSLVEPQSLESTAEDENDSSVSRAQKDAASNEEADGSDSRYRSRRHFVSRACERSKDGASNAGYDIILMSETVYSQSSLPKLYSLLKLCLRPYYGVVYVSGKKHYFGVGGGTRQFKHLIEEDGILGAHLVAEFADGSSNVREIWKFFFK